MTLCLAWNKGNSYYFASDSKLTSGIKEVTSIATKIFSIPVIIKYPDKKNIKEILYKGELGMCFAGSYLSGSSIAIAITEVLSSIEVIPNISDYSIENLIEISFKLYKKICEKIQGADTLIGGYCPISNEFKLFKFWIEKNKDENTVLYYKKELNFFNNDIFMIGDSNAINNAQSLLDKNSKNVFEVLKQVINNTNIFGVGGAIQAGVFFDNSFTTMGIVEYELEKKDNINRVKFKNSFKGIDLDLTYSELELGEVVISKPILDPFGNQRRTLQEKAKKLNEEEFERSRKDLVNLFFIKRLWLGINLGGFIVPISNENELLEYDKINPTGIIIEEKSKHIKEIISLSESLILTEQSGLNIDSFNKLCSVYINKIVKENNLFCFPGMSIIINNFKNYKDFVDSIYFPQKEYSEEVLKLMKQPSLIKVDKIENELENITKIVEEHLVHGLIFNSFDELEKFDKHWNSKVRASNLLPYLFLEADYQYLLKNSKNNIIDGFISKSLFSEEQYKNIIKENVNYKISNNLISNVNNSSVNIGIISLSGTYKGEINMFEFIKHDFKSKNINFYFINSFSDMEKMDGIIFPAGKEHNQLEIFSNMTSNFFQNIKTLIKKKINMYFSCSSSSVFRNPNKNSINCSLLEPAGVLDTSVHNCIINGIHDFTLIPEDKSFEGIFYNSHFFTELGLNVKPISTLTKDKEKIIAIEQIEDSGAILVGTSCFHYIFLKYWLDKFI